MDCTCLICADGNSERAWAQATECRPQLIFWPEVIDRARLLGVSVIATSRVGFPGAGNCAGGAIIMDRESRILAHSLRPRQEEIIVAEVPLA